MALKKCKALCCHIICIALVTAPKTEQKKETPQNKQNVVKSPLTELPADIIGQFPNDYMHQANFGGIKKLLTIWTRGEKGCSRQTMMFTGQIHVARAR